MTGMYPFRAGMQHSVIHPLQPKGVPTKFAFLPEKLKELGYATHIVGKWHLGFCNVSYTPLHRGFDTHYGYYNGEEDYYHHVRTYNPTASGYDFRNNSEPDLTANGTYSTFLFAERAQEIIGTHDVEKPLFLYLPFQAVHSPIQVPERFENGYPKIQHVIRRKYSGMVSALDEAVGNITNALVVKGMMDNTIIVFTTDNGGLPPFGGNNWPLRGEKSTLWEGGTRGPAFVMGGVFKAMQGTIYNGLFHAVDWFPTLLAAAGYAGRLPKTDGMNQLENLIAANSPGVRTEFVYNIDDIMENGAIRVGNWKLIVGTPGLPGTNGWTPVPTIAAGENNLNTRFADDDDEINLDPGRRQLFDLGNDPTEHHDLSKMYPYIANEMYERLLELTSGYKAYNPHDVPDGNPKYFGGFWSPGWCKAQSNVTLDK
jgi:arylsulfatase A-like enzyme